jgi:dTDP-4-dehydrorhamnose 3,5-epimerase
VTPVGSQPVGLVVGCRQVAGVAAKDHRGAFAKVLGVESGLDEEFRVRELFWSRSHAGVVRGVHCQIPPHQGRKLVWVTAGAILDVVVDLRVGSPTYLRWASWRLDVESSPLLVPAGCGHGFATLGADSIVNYAQECVYSPECDTGVRWDSIGISWPIADPIVSDRDRSLPRLEEFSSPFAFLGPT